ncbi:MAG: c-type cytochrome [Planctomycetota bacterium]|jgi:mono/diheme cytochrome c family protein
MIGPKLEKKLKDWEPRWRPFRFKATLIGLVAASVVVPLLILAVPYLELFNDMAVQPVAKPQGDYGWFTDQALMVPRPPVPGTVPMDDLGFTPYVMEGETPEEAAQRAEETLSNPLLPTLDVLKRGQKYFNIYCIVCHGPRGEANGPIVGPDLFPAPLSLHSPQALAFEDGRIFHVISVGQRDMPSYADKLTWEERWSVVHYVRALQRTMQGEDGR